MKLREIKRVITSVNNSGIEELNLNWKSVKITVKKKNQSKIGNKTDLETKKMDVTTETISNRIIGGSMTDYSHEKKNYSVVKSEFIGVFCNPLNNKDILIGSTVKKGDELGLVAALNLQNTVVSNISGEIVDILVKENSPVHFDEPLFVIAE